MNKDEELTNLEQLLDRLDEAAQRGERTTFGTMVEVVGRRSFGPLLLLAGLIALSPLSGIPGIPTIVAATVVLIAGQLLLGRRHFWLPRWILKRGISRQKFEKAVRFLRVPARWVDRLLRPRLKVLTHDAGVYAIAVLCVLIAASMPPMELVPFAATAAGAALTALGLSVIAHDGLLALVALTITGTTAAFVVQKLI